MAVEVRCFGERPPDAGGHGIVVRGYTPWARVSAGPDGPRFAPALETLSIALAMARDHVDADIAHAHTWYADMAGLWIRTLYRIPLVVTLHSMEPLRPWKADQLSTGYLRSEEHTSELQSQSNLVCRLLLEKKNKSIHGGLHPPYQAV